MSKHEQIQADRWIVTQVDVFELISDLRAKGQRFCLATVIRTADLTSAKAGAKALVTQDGEIIGHLGGACVCGAVTKTAAEVLRTGAARMISVRPSDAASDDLDTEVHSSGCPSGGTVDVFIEPFLQPFQVCVLGNGPIAKAVRAHAALMGFAVFDDVTEQAGVDAVVIASQGANDLAALRRALQSPAAIVTMVASHRKAEHLKTRLREEGMDRERLDQLISPAGLDIGAIDPHEIAVSILALLIHKRRSGHGS
ncbi:MAG: XdhC family protein [Pseudomonadota bacterium]